MPISTHVLDTALGTPAAGVAVVLYAVDTNGVRTPVARSTTNADGRTDAPLAAAPAPGAYELVFSVGAYFAARGTASFYDDVPVRFRVDDAAARYHVPLLISPWAYSTYRGS
jgi:5-hydroxyisourate hydrolase